MLINEGVVSETTYRYGYHLPLENFPIGERVSFGISCDSGFREIGYCNSKLCNPDVKLFKLGNIAFRSSDNLFLRNEGLVEIPVVVASEALQNNYFINISMKFSNLDIVKQFALSLEFQPYVHPNGDILPKFREDESQLQSEPQSDTGSHFQIHLVQFFFFLCCLLLI